MSFILDALQRAQKVHDAQTVDTAPILAERVTDAPANPQARVLWGATAVLGLISAVLIAWMMGRESAAPVSRTAADRTSAAPAALPASPFGQSQNETPARGQVRSLNVEAARARPAPAAPAPTTAAAATPGMIEIAPVANRTVPSQGSVTVMPASNSPSASRSAEPAPGPAEPAPAVADPALPDYENMLLGGQINLPNLRMDMHVYHANPERRFVFINFKKYGEGDAVDSDTQVEEITSGGAVLNHDGKRFVLRPN